MKLELKFNDKERRILYILLAVVLSVSYIIIGVYAISYFIILGFIKGSIQIVSANGLHLLQCYLVTRAVFKYYS